MATTSPKEVTQLLVDWSNGSEEALQKLMPLAIPEQRELDLLALDDALNSRASFDPQQSRIVELRFFGGLSIEDAAEVLEVSTATVKRDWAMVKAWLHRQISQR